MPQENQDIRWKQRLSNYTKALAQLTLFFEKADSLNRLEEQGLIKAFEYNYELAWNCIKDFYESQGKTGIQGSRDAIQLAFKRELIVNGEAWMQMLQDRNRTSHSYNEETANEIVAHIISSYYQLFIALRNELQRIAGLN